MSAGGETTPRDLSRGDPDLPPLHRETNSFPADLLHAVPAPVKPG